MTPHDLKEQSDSGDSQMGQAKETKKKAWRWLRWLIGIAAVLVVLLAASFFIVRHIWGSEIGHQCIEKAHDSHDPSRALVLYRLALLWDPSRSDARANRVSLFIQMKKVKRALRECDRWIKARPNDADAYARKAWILLDQGRAGDALATFDKLIKLLPKQAQGYIGRGDVHFQQKEYEKALAEYDRAIERGGGKLGVLGQDSHAKRAAVHLELGDYEKAVADYNRAIEIETEAAEAQERRAIETAERYPKFDIDETLSIQKRHLASVYSLRGHAYAKAERYDEAMADIDKAIELDPKNAGYLIQRGWLYTYRQERDTARAIEDFTEAIKKSEEKMETADQDLQKSTEAPEYTRESLEQYYLELKARHTRTMAEAYYYRARAQFLQDNEALAMEDLDKTIELNPEYAEAYGTRAWFFEKKGETDRAFSDVNRAIELDPGVEWGYYCRGFLLYYMDDFNGALQDFVKAAEVESAKIYPYVWQYLSRRRLGEEDAGHELAEAGKSIEMEDWEKAIVEFILDDITAEELLKAAKDKDSRKQNEKQCEAYFCIGQQFLLEGNNEEARGYFGKSVATGVEDFLEYQAAEKELEKLESREE